MIKLHFLGILLQGSFVGRLYPASGYELGMFHFIAMDWQKAHEHLNCVYLSVNSDKASLLQLAFFACCCRVELCSIVKKIQIHQKRRKEIQ